MGRDITFSVRDKPFLLHIQTVSCVPVNVRNENAGKKNHVGGAMLPFIDLLPEILFHALPVWILYMANEAAAHIHLVPGSLVNRKHGDVPSVRR